jgi:hypothetical protein
VAITRKGLVTALLTATPATIDITSLGCAAGDVLVVWQAGGAQTVDVAAPTISGDVTGTFDAAVADLYSNDTYDTNAFLYVQVLAGADTTLTVGVGYWHVLCYSGVSNSNPLDVAVTTATGINTDVADAPSISPVTAGTKIVALYGGAVQAPTAWVAPTNISNFNQNQSSNNIHTSIGSGDADWTSGAFDPAAVTGGQGNSNNSWAAATVALRIAGNTYNETLSEAATANQTFSNAVTWGPSLSFAATAGYSLSNTAHLHVTIGEAAAAADLYGGGTPQFANLTETTAAGFSASASVTLPFAPVFDIKHADWVLDRPSTINASAYAGNAQVLTDPWRATWHAHIDLAPIVGENNMLPIRQFIGRVNGMIKAFRVYATENIQNNNSGVTVASSAAQGATTIALAGYTDTMKEGQLMTINRQLVICTANQSGANVSFEPPLRQPASAGTAVETKQPYALMHMSVSKVGWNVGPGKVYNVSFDLQEAVKESEAT